MPRYKRRCPRCQFGHNRNQSLCTFCEEELQGAVGKPVVGIPANTPQANRFRVGLGTALRSNSMGRKAKTF